MDASRLELGHPLSSICAVIAMIAASVLARCTRFAAVVPEAAVWLELGFVVGVGSITYVAVLWLVRHLTRSVRQTARVLASVSSVAVTDPVAAVRTEFRKIAGAAYPAEFVQLGVAVDRLLGVAHDQAVRQTAWTVSTVHDMKAPIAAGANAVEAIATRTEGPDADVLRAIGKDLRGLGGDIQRMMDVVRFAHTDVELMVDPIDLADLVAEVVERIPLRDGVHVSSRGRAIAFGDRRLLARALENLVANGIRYARSHVAIEVLPGLVRVADDGGGLPAPLHELTRPFRSDAALVSGVRVEGGASGIGLFLARRVLELHGGRLVVESSGPTGTVVLAYIGAPRDGRR